MEWERGTWIREYLSGESISEIARRHQISRKALYKWIERYKAYGEEGLRDLSRAPGRQWQAVDGVWHERIAAVRQEHGRWGAPKLHWLLEQRHGSEGVPSVSTIGRILKQQGLTPSRARRRGGDRWPINEAEKPNDVWCIDFKGWRRTSDGQTVHPLTVTDQATRYLLCCQGLAATRTELVKPRLERVFREYGLPLRMRSDNGSPFGGGGPCGLTELSVWWIELGIVLERIEPGHPQQNGRHERMHRTLSETTMTPPAATPRQQQKRFDEFRRHFNEERPHQALGQKPPGMFYDVSPRPWPGRVPEPVYGLGWSARPVSGRGQVRWAGTRIFISHALHGKQIGFEPVADGIWRLWFRHYWLGLWDERRQRLRRAHEIAGDGPEAGLRPVPSAANA